MRPPRCTRDTCILLLAGLLLTAMSIAEAIGKGPFRFDLPLSAVGVLLTTAVAIAMIVSAWISSSSLLIPLTLSVLVLLFRTVQLTVALDEILELRRATRVVLGVYMWAPPCSVALPYWLRLYGLTATPLDRKSGDPVGSKYSADGQDL